MVSRYHMMMLVVCSLIVAGAVVSLDARKQRASNSARCDSKESCENSRNCQCYCSGIGGFRNKTKNDRPIYVPKDDNKVYCYCKQWDLDNFPQAERPAGMVE